MSDATDLANLQARRSAIYAELANIAPGQPGYGVTYTADGRTFDHVGYRKSLLDELQTLNVQISMLSPFEECGQAMT